MFTICKEISNHTHVDGEIHIVLRKGKPYKRCRGGKVLHRVIAEKALGRRLKSDEVVHHIDKDTLNNKNSNLLICTQDYHLLLHKLMQGG